MWEGPGVKTMLTGAIVALALLVSGSADAQTAGPCAAVSPSAAPCTLAQKVTEALIATQADTDAYLKTWTHRAVTFQSRLGDRLPLREATYLGTHNSFNSLTNGFTVSHSDSNQQMSLVQQLDSDIRSIELDLHVIGGQVTVCHGRGPDELHAGCTTERPFTEVLAPVKAWLDAHPDEVLLLYLEDELGADSGYASTLQTLDGALRIYKPDPAQKTAKGCTNLPLTLTRREIRAAGAQVVIVGNCVSKWSADVFGWDAVHVESGSTARYAAFPTCDATYKRDVYTAKLVRYYEDSTFVATAISPTTPPVDPDRLTPEKVKAMITCGVGLFGFDQLLPDDGRLAATLWSWAPGEPKLAGACALMGADGRWVARACTERHRAACAKGKVWTVTAKGVTYAQAGRACRASSKARPGFGLPYSANSNAELHRLIGDGDVWLHYRSGRSTPAAP